MRGSASEWSLVTTDGRKAAQARKHVRRFIAAQADASSDLDAVEIIAGELIANVILHAGGAIGIHAYWEGHRGMLIVADRGPGIPPIRSVPDLDATSGRGLLLIQALAKRMEIDAAPGSGSRILVELPVRRAA